MTAETASVVGVVVRPMKKVQAITGGEGNDDSKRGRSIVTATTREWEEAEALTGLLGWLSARAKIGRGGR